MKILHLTNSDKVCEECLREYPDSPLNACIMIDRRYLCGAHADDEINRDLYNEIDHEYNNFDEDES